MKEYRWVVVAGRLVALHEARKAADIAGEMRAAGTRNVAVRPAPNPTTIPHGRRWHECTDTAAACVRFQRALHRELRANKACIAYRVHNNNCPCDQCADSEAL